VAVRSADPAADAALTKTSGAVALPTFPLSAAFRPASGSCRVDATSGCDAVVVAEGARNGGRSPRRRSAEPQLAGGMRPGIDEARSSGRLGSDSSGHLSTHATPQRRAVPSCSEQLSAFNLNGVDLARSAAAAIRAATER